MRAVLVLAILGCTVGCGDVPPPAPPDAGVWTDPGGPISFPEGCTDDSACPTGEVCARVGGCTAADQIRAVHVYWTLSGKPANATTCDATRSLYLRISPPDGIGIGWAPVPCSQGKFTVDKLPIDYTVAKLSLGFSDNPQQGTFDPVTGEVTIDLPF